MNYKKILLITFFTVTSFALHAMEDGQISNDNNENSPVQELEIPTLYDTCVHNLIKLIQAGAEVPETSESHDPALLVNGLRALLQNKKIDQNAIPETVNLLSKYHAVLPWPDQSEFPEYSYEPTTLNGHNDWVSCLAIAGNRLFSGSDDKTIKVWNTEDYKEIATLNGHNDSVYCLAIAGNRLFSGSDDKTIKVWNTEDYKEIATLNGHNDVYCLAIAGNRLFSGSDDDTIKVWNTEDYKGIATLNGHNDSVYCLAIAGNRLFSGSDDKTIKVWNTEDYKEIATFNGHNDLVRCLAIAGNRLFSGSDDDTIKVWNTEDYKEIATLNEHNDLVRCLAIAGNRLFSGSDDKTIKVWDIDQIFKKLLVLKLTKLCSDNDSCLNNNSSSKRFPCKII